MIGLIAIGHKKKAFCVDLLAISLRRRSRKISVFAGPLRVLIANTDPLPPWIIANTKLAITISVGAFPGDMQEFEFTGFVSEYRIGRKYSVMKMITSEAISKRKARAK